MRRACPWCARFNPGTPACRWCHKPVIYLNGKPTIPKGAQ